MAETNEQEISNGENKTLETKTPDKNPTPPVVVEFAGTGGKGVPGSQSEQPKADAPQTEQQQAGKPEQTQNVNKPPLTADAPPAPVVADGAVKQPAAKETEKQPSTQGKAAQEAPVDDKLRKEQEALLKSLDSKADDLSKKNPTPKQKTAPAQEKTAQPSKSDRPIQAVKPVNTEKKPPEKTEKATRAARPPQGPKEEKKILDFKSGSMGGIGGAIGKSAQTPEKEAALAPAAPPVPEPPRDATRPGEKETIVYIDHSELHPFKNHPFKVRDDDEMKSLVASVKERGIDQPAIVRPREEGGYEIVAGHRRQAASEMAGIKNVPCVVRRMTDEEAVLAMTESNFNQRSEILASERAQALKMQLDAIKRQGERFNGVATGDIGRRSNEIVADKNKMSAKTVQRYIALNNLVPDLIKLADDKKIPFMTAFEMSYIKPKNQEYLAMTIESQQSAPTLAQAQRMRELDQKGVLNGDVIDGIMLETKKGVCKIENAERYAIGEKADEPQRPHKHNTD